jgi:hypothetical protein
MKSSGTSDLKIDVNLKSLAIDNEPPLTIEIEL